MESLKEFLHIDLKWEKDEFKSKEWHLTFDKEKIMTVIQGNWFFFNFMYMKSHIGNWSIKRKGFGPYIFEIKDRTIVGRQLFTIGFKNRFNLGMFNATSADTFEWKRLKVGSGYGWHIDDLEVIRYERTGRSLTKFNYSASIVNGRVEEEWLAAMLATGFMALK